jgi:type VI secretion system secreted protein Hcp
MASEIFLKVDGIDGEATTSGFEAQIQLLSFGWGCSQQHSASHGTGLGAEGADFQDVHFSKIMDKSSPKIEEACYKGDHIKEITLTVREAGGKPLEYYKVKYEDCLFSHYQTDGNEGGGKCMESGAFAYSKFTVTYQSQDKTGTKKDKVEVEHDLKAGVK